MKYLTILFLFCLFVSNAFANIDECPEGTYINGDKCEDCLPGYYQPNTGQTACLPCELGRSQSQGRAAKCEGCAIGEYQDQEGQVSCIVCPPGTTTSFVGSASKADCKSADSVPAMNRWGLLLLIGSVLGVATLLLRRLGTFGN